MQIPFLVMVIVLRIGILLCKYRFNTDNAINKPAGWGGLWELCCKGKIKDHADGDRRKHGIANGAPYGRTRIKASWLLGMGNDMKGLGIMGGHSVLLVSGHKVNASQETVSSGKRKPGKDKRLIRVVVDADRSSQVIEVSLETLQTHRSAAGRSSQIHRNRRMDVECRVHAPGGEIIVVLGYAASAVTTTRTYKRFI